MLVNKVTISDITGIAPKAGDLGLELEVEAKNKLPVINTASWTSAEDHSLRNGLEYVSNGPFNVVGKRLKIKSLIEKIDKPEYGLIRDSHRTSFHVHKNVLSYDVVEAWTAIDAFWLVENLLLELCHPERKGNLFCLRIKDAEGIIEDAVNDCKSKNPFFSFNQEQHKYGALNLGVVTRYGSIEVRPKHGTIDVEELDEWSTAVNDVCENARKNFTNPANLLDIYFRRGWRHIVTVLFSDPVRTKLLAIRNGGELVEENALRILSVAYSQSWDQYRLKIAKLYTDQKKEEKVKLNNAGERIRRAMAQLAEQPVQIQPVARQPLRRRAVNQDLNNVNMWANRPWGGVLAGDRIEVAMPQDPRVIEE